MNALVSHLAAATGLDAGTAEQVTAVFIASLGREGPPEATIRLVAALPGTARNLAAEHRPAVCGGVPGAGGLASVAQPVSVLGPDARAMRRVAQDVVAYGRIAAGDDDVDDIVGTIPDLSDFLGAAPAVRRANFEDEATS